MINYFKRECTEFKAAPANFFFNLLKFQLKMTELNYYLYVIYHLTYQFFLFVASAMVGPRAWIGGLFNRSANRRNERFHDYHLTPPQVR